MLTWLTTVRSYLMDFSGGVEFLLKACALAKRVILIDHHKTAQEDLVHELCTHTETKVTSEGCKLSRCLPQ